LSANAKYQWVNISGDLPLNLAAVSVFADWEPAIPAFYVGMERGVYRSINLGQHWERFGANMPNTVVSDLQYQANEHILAAATFGRGAVEILITPTTISGDVYWDHDGNGIRSGGDKGLPGVTVFLDTNGNGQHDSNEIGTLTNDTGDYSFANVPTGTYVIR